MRNRRRYEAQMRPSPCQCTLQVGYVQSQAEVLRRDAREAAARQSGGLPTPYRQPRPRTRCAREHSSPSRRRRRRASAAGALTRRSAQAIRESARNSRCSAREGLRRARAARTRTRTEQPQCAARSDCGDAACRAVRSDWNASMGRRCDQCAELRGRQSRGKSSRKCAGKEWRAHVLRPVRAKSGAIVITARLVFRAVLGQAGVTALPTGAGRSGLYRERGHHNISQSPVHDRYACAFRVKQGTGRVRVRETGGAITGGQCWKWRGHALPYALSGVGAGRRKRSARGVGFRPWTARGRVRRVLWRALEAARPRKSDDSPRAHNAPARSPSDPKRLKPPSPPRRTRPRPWRQSDTHTSVVLTLAVCCARRVHGAASRLRGPPATGSAVCACSSIGCGAMHVMLAISASALQAAATCAHSLAWPVCFLVVRHLHRPGAAMAWCCAAAPSSGARHEAARARLARRRTSHRHRHAYGAGCYDACC